jgi:DUF2075 family protein
MYKGKNQVDDVIRSSRVTILFVDDNQQIRPVDIGSTHEIRRLAKHYQADLIELKLSAQFRCAGAEGFLNWISDVLQIEHTANFDGWDTTNFDFQIFETPHQVYEAIQVKALNGFKSRLLAGYAWNWTSEKEGNSSGQVKDVTIEECDFAMPWNKRSSRELWAIQPDGLNYVGCIHTSQGLEFDHVGVIIGNDLKYDPIQKFVYADASEYKDSTGKKGISKNPEELKRLIKNIYRVLCSRGMKGCYIYCRNPELNRYFKQRFSQVNVNETVFYDIDDHWDISGLKVADGD